MSHDIKPKDEVVSFGKNGKLIKEGDYWIDNFLMKTVEDVLEYRECEAGDNDVIVSTYPRSGTTWVNRILVFLKLDCDVEKANSAPYFDFINAFGFKSLSDIMASPEPRYITVHMPYRNLPKSFRNGKGKIIYVSRNPKDVIVSNYKLHQMYTPISLDIPFEDFVELFMDEHQPFPFGHWINHVKPFWEHRNDENLLFLKYEDLKKDLKGKIAEIASFLGKELTKEQVDIIADQCSFSSMKSNPAANGDWMVKSGVLDNTKSEFIRKGVIGDWKNYFTPELRQKVDEKIEKELGAIGLHYTTE